MSRTLTLTVDDSAPMITYSPSLDQQLLPQNQQLELLGWIPQYNNRFLNSLGDLGNGSSSHLTGLKGASFQFDFAGTGITLLGIAQQISYDVRLDGSLFTSVPPQADRQTLYENLDLAPGNHTVSLIVHEAFGTPESFISFDKAVLQTKVNITRDAQVLPQLVSDSSVAFKGSWSAMQIQSEMVSGSDDLAITTFHQTGTAGDSVTFQLPFPSESDTSTTRPISLSILGLRNTFNGLYTVSISDNQGRSIKQTHNASFGWFTATELFAIPDLNLALGSPPGASSGLDKLTVTVTNDEAKPLAIAAINVTNIVVPPAASSFTASSTMLPTISAGSDIGHSKLPSGTIVALALSSVSIAIFIILALIFFLWRRRWRRKQRGIFTSPPDNSFDHNAPPKSKSKSESGGSVLDIGRPAPIRGPGGTPSPKDRFAHSVRQLSLPRTVRSSFGNGNGSNGNGRHHSPPDLTDDFGPTLSVPRNTPFIFSFGTSSSNSPASRRSFPFPRSRGGSGDQAHTRSTSHANTASSDSGRRQRPTPLTTDPPPVSRFSVSTQPQNSIIPLSQTNTNITPTSNMTMFNQPSQEGNQVLAAQRLQSRFSDSTRQTGPRQHRTSGNSFLYPISIPGSTRSQANTNADSPILPSEEHSGPPTTRVTPPDQSPPATARQAMHARSRSDPEALTRLLPQLQIPQQNNPRSQPNTTALTAASRPYEWGFAYRPESWGSTSMIRSHASTSDEESRDQPAVLFTLPTPTDATHPRIHPFAQTYTPEGGNSRRTSAQTERSTNPSTFLEPGPYASAAAARRGGHTLLPFPSAAQRRGNHQQPHSRMETSASDSEVSPTFPRAPGQFRRGVRRSISLVFRNRSSLEAEDVNRMRPPGFELGDVILGPRPQQGQGDR